MFTLALGPGCCGLFQPTEATERNWVKLNIPSGTLRKDVIAKLKQHRFAILEDSPDEVEGGIITGRCVGNPFGDGLMIQIELDKSDRSKKASVYTFKGF